MMAFYGSGAKLVCGGRLFDEGETAAKSVGYFSECAGSGVTVSPGRMWYGFCATTPGFFSGEHASGAGGSFKRVNMVLGVCVVFASSMEASMKPSMSSSVLSSVAISTGYVFKAIF